MKLLLKLVALLALIALLLPTAAVATCLSGAPATKGCCPRCPTAKGANGTGAHMQSSRCCSVQKSSPAPVTESKIVAPHAQVINAPVQVAMVPPVAPQQRDGHDVQSPPPLAKSQARLCTFLI